MATIGFSAGAQPAQTAFHFGNSFGQSSVAAQGFGTTAFGEGGGAPRISSLALGGDLNPIDYRSIRTDNLAVLELPVPSEIISIVENLQNQVKNHKQIMIPLIEATEEDKLFSCVAQQIGEVKLSLDNLSNLMDKQNFQTTLLIRDTKKAQKNMDLISQAWDNGTASSSSGFLDKFLIDLVTNLNQRLSQYKSEVEKAEITLQSSQGTSNAKDLWNSLTAIKDTVVLLAGKIQQLEEDLEQELKIHKKLTSKLIC